MTIPENLVVLSPQIQSPLITKMAIPVSWFREIKSSNAAGMLKLSVSSSRVLSATGREWSVELSLQYRHRQITSSPDRTAALYCSLVIPVSQRRCCHLSQPSHSNASWRDVTCSVQTMQQKLAISNDELMTSCRDSFPKSFASSLMGKSNTRVERQYKMADIRANTWAWQN